MYHFFCSSADWLCWRAVFARKFNKSSTMSKNTNVDVPHEIDFKKDYHKNLILKCTPTQFDSSSSWRWNTYFILCTNAKMNFELNIKQILITHRTHPFRFSFYCDQNRISDFNFTLPLSSIDFRLSSTNLIYDSQWNQAWWKKIHKLRLVEDVAMIKMEVK